MAPLREQLVAVATTDIDRDYIQTEWSYLADHLQQCTVEGKRSQSSALSVNRAIALLYADYLQELMSQGLSLDTALTEIENNLLAIVREDNFCNPTPPE